MFRKQMRINIDKYLPVFCSVSVILGCLFILLCYLYPETSYFAQIALFLFCMPVALPVLYFFITFVTKDKGKKAETTGVIVDYKVVHVVGSGKTFRENYHIYPIAEFTVDGKTYKAVSNEVIIARYKTEQSKIEMKDKNVKIIYNEEDPRQAKIKYNKKQFLEFYGRWLVLIFVPIIWVLLATLVLYIKERIIKG